LHMQHKVGRRKTSNQIRSGFAVIDCSCAAVKTLASLL
jgi:hypothetical protein